VSSENSAKAPTEKHSFDEKKSLFTDDDVQRIAMVVLSGLRSGVSILLGEGSEECLLSFCFVIFASILDIIISKLSFC
jgi:hypothetical protein